MSVGHLCEYCGQGRVRPIQFSLEQAVVTCDNKYCESRLEISPWDCIIDRKLNPTVDQHSVDLGRLHLWSRSSSSSGVHSDYRSPALSPTRSCDSVTDREVENLLNRQNAPPLGAKWKPLKNKFLQYHHQTTVSDEKGPEVKSNESFASFFELLNNLDLDVPSHHLVKKECMPLDKTGIDSPTLELANWIRSPEKVHSKSLASAPNHQVEGAKTIQYCSPIKDRVYIPSRDSAFSQVSSKKDSSRKFWSDAAGSLGDPCEVNEKYENEYISCGKSCDVSENKISICDIGFLSPAESALSDDSGCEDSGIKANLVHLPSFISETAGNQSCSSPFVEETGDVSLSHHKRSASKGVSNIAIDMKVTDCNAQETSAPLSVVSFEPLSDSVASEWAKMETEEENFSSSAICLSSSQLSETEKHTSQSGNKNNAITSQNIRNSVPFKQLCDSDQDICTKNTNVEECRIRKRPGRPKGSWRKPQYVTVKRNKRVPMKSGLRKEEESNIASLKKGLATLLQAPTVQIKKDGNRNQNLTNLSFRSRLSVRYSFSL